MKTKIERVDNKNSVGQPQRVYEVLVQLKNGEWVNPTNSASRFYYEAQNFAKRLESGNIPSMWASAFVGLDLAE